MAQYYEDFRDAVLDSIPSDFSLVWGGLTLDFEIKAGNVLPNSDRHLLLTAGGGNFQRLALQWGVGLTEGKTTVRCLLEFDPLISTTTRVIPGAFLSGSGNQSTRTGYAQWFGASNRLSKYNSGTDSAVATESTPLSAGVTTRYLEIVRDGATIETRSWLYGTERPVDPDLTFTDGSPLPVSGFFGLSYLPGGSATPSKLLSIAAGTNGDPAPTEPVPSGVITLPADAGVFSLTGRQASLSIHRKLTAQPGNFTLTGRNAALALQRRLVAGAGAYSLQGHDAELVIGIAPLVAESGHYLMTGNDVTMQINKGFALESGMFLSTMGDLNIKPNGYLRIAPKTAHYQRVN